MLQVSEEIKNLYRGNLANPQGLTIYFPSLNLIIPEEKILYESMTITESICENEELTFGDSNSAEFKISVADIGQDLTGHRFTVTQMLNGNPEYIMPLGTYTVKSYKRQPDRWFRDIVAYDDMQKLGRDVTAWYNSRPWPLTLKSLRESLLIYCGLEYEKQDLKNDGVKINKTIRPASMNGRDVMKRICELSGGFGHITRQNKFKVITLAGVGLYPSETLYPSEDLFPADPSEVIDGSSSGAWYLPESTYEDYICRSIDQIRIRTNEEDGGIVVNDGKEGKNEYIVQGNFLISDKSKKEMEDIAKAIFLIIKNKYYRPHNMVVTGLPYLEVGDSILISTMDDVIESFIFSRTLSGIQSLKDSLSATGYEYRQNKVGLDVQISQLEQSTSDLQEATEEIEQDIEDIYEFNGQTTVRLEKLGDSIVAEVSRAVSAEEELSGRIDVTAEEVSIKVSKGDVSSQLSVESGQVTIASNRLVVDSTNFKLDANGNCTMAGKVTATSGKIGNFSIVNGELKNSGGTSIYDNYIETGSLFAKNMTLNQSPVATQSYVSNASVKHADTADYADTARKCENETSASHTPNCFITSAMTIYRINSGSSRRFKNRITEKIGDGLDPSLLYKIPVVQFEYKPSFLKKPEGTKMPTVIGLIAEDVEEIYPCAAEYDEETGEVENWNYRYLIPPMLKLIQEQKKEIDCMKDEIREIKNFINMERMG